MKAAAPALTPLPYDDRHNCFGCGAQNRVGMRLRFFVDPAGGVVAFVRMPKRFQGPHGFVHGGVLAALLDEIMSKSIHAAAHGAGIMALTRRMETEYLRPAPLGVPLTLRGREERTEGRKHFCSATLTDAEGVLLTSATGLFIAVARQAEHKH